MCAVHHQPETNHRPFLVLLYAGQLLGNSLHVQCPLKHMRLQNALRVRTRVYVCACLFETNPFAKQKCVMVFSA